MEFSCMNIVGFFWSAALALERVWFLHVQRILYFFIFLFPFLVFFPSFYLWMGFFGFAMFILSFCPF